MEFIVVALFIICCILGVLIRGTQLEVDDLREEIEIIKRVQIEQNENQIIRK